MSRKPTNAASYTGSESVATGCDTVQRMLWPVSRFRHPALILVLLVKSRSRQTLGHATSELSHTVGEAKD